MKKIYHGLDMSGNFIINSPNLVTSVDDYSKIKAITKADYDALVDKDENTYYMIVDDGEGVMEAIAAHIADRNNPHAVTFAQSGGYGKNLLTNPDFRINQRNITGTITHSDTASENYFVDRWYLKSGSVTVNDNGSLTLNGTIIQILENAVGTDATASASAGTASYDDSTRTFTLTGNGDVITWAKLERGAVSTPFEKPDPALEIIKCQQSFEMISRAVDNSFILSREGAKRFIVNIPFCTSKKDMSYDICCRVPRVVIYHKNGFFQVIWQDNLNIYPLGKDKNSFALIVEVDDYIYSLFQDYFDNLQYAEIDFLYGHLSVDDEIYPAEV